MKIIISFYWEESADTIKISIKLICEGSALKLKLGGYKCAI
tara:strand:+ start:1050 stop:1172 length:123 start_codon:yes stop_codon:yes gene_type:complete